MFLEERWDVRRSCDGVVNFEKEKALKIVQSRLEAEDDPLRIIEDCKKGMEIVEAKKILKGHASIYGDIPPQLTAYGSQEKVEAYVKMLIDEVGYDGGLTISNGCAMPPNAKLENFRVMLETTKTYELSRN
jgi:uroporphyrinogen-III decarboxylase